MERVVILGGGPAGITAAKMLGVKSFDRSGNVISRAHLTDGGAISLNEYGEDGWSKLI